MEDSEASGDQNNGNKINDELNVKLIKKDKCCECKQSCTFMLPVTVMSFDLTGCAARMIVEIWYLGVIGEESHAMVTFKSPWKVSRG